VETSFVSPAPRALDERLRMHLDMLAERAGLRLTPSQRTEFYDSSTHALAMMQRIRATANSTAGTEPATDN
jgi:hypothetical protein